MHAQGMNPLSGPTLIRSLATATQAYRSVVADSLSVITEAIQDSQGPWGGQYFVLLDHLRALLETPEIGSLPAIEAECAELLGET
jgi:hypothetical protein